MCIAGMYGIMGFAVAARSKMACLLVVLVVPTDLGTFVQVPVGVRPETILILQLEVHDDDPAMQVDPTTQDTMFHDVLHECVFDAFVSLQRDLGWSWCVECYFACEIPNRCIPLDGLRGALVCDDPTQIRCEVIILVCGVCEKRRKEVGDVTYELVM